MKQSSAHYHRMSENSSCLCFSHAGESQRYVDKAAAEIKINWSEVKERKRGWWWKKKKIPSRRGKRWCCCHGDAEPLLRKDCSAGLWMDGHRSKLHKPVVNVNMTNRVLSLHVLATEIIFSSHYPLQESACDCEVQHTGEIVYLQYYCFCCTVCLKGRINLFKAVIINIFTFVTFVSNNNVRMWKGLPVVMIQQLIITWISPQLDRALYPASAHCSSVRLTTLLFWFTLCLYRMHSGTVSSVGHPRFSSPQGGSIHNDCSCWCKIEENRHDGVFTQSVSATFFCPTFEYSSPHRPEANMLL